MSGIQGISVAGSMSKSCGMKSMHDSSKVKLQDGMQGETKRQSASKVKIPNQLLESKIDVKA
jgi:hypothetical protein